MLVFTIPASIINDVYYLFGKAGFRVKCTSHPLVGVIELLNGSYLNTSDGLTLLVNTEIEPISLSVFKRDKLEHIRFLTSIDRTNHEIFAESLSLELKRTILFCKQYYSGATIDSMIYSGPLDSDFFEFTESIYNPTDMAVKVVRISNCDSKPDCDLGTWLSYYLPGLCGLHMLKRPFSLLPPKKDHFDFSTSHAYVKTLATSLIAIVLLVSFLAVNLINGFTEQRDRLESQMGGITAEKMNLDGLGNFEDRIAAMDVYYSKTKDFLSLIDSQDSRFTPPIFTFIGSLPETSKIAALGITGADTSSDETRTFTVHIRDNFTGRSSSSLKTCTDEIRNSRLFGNVNYRILESVLAENPSLSREEAIVEATQ